MNRQETLEKAKEIVLGHREDEYGSPEDNFAVIADLWTTYLSSKITTKIKDPSLKLSVLLKLNINPEDVAMMMALLKIARIATGTATEDSFVDIAGYAACGCEIVTNGDAE